MIPFYPDTVPIIFASNDYFVPYMAAMMQSIMENANPGRQYRFFVLHRDISLENQALLRAQIQKYPNFGLDFVDVTARVESRRFFTGNRADITVETYFRLFIPDLFAACDKVIYLDGDMICRADIAELFDIDIGDAMIGAARNFADLGRFYRGEKTSANCYDTLSHLDDPRDYYCAGALVFNVQRFRAAIFTEQLLGLAVSRKWRQHDQDILNHVTQGRVFFLPQEWNLIQMEHAAALPVEFREEYARAAASPRIIHFAGVREKPWICPVYVKNFEYFWMYAARTPFLEEITKRMTKNHLIGEGYENFVVDEIRHRNGGLRFILKCLMAWLVRDKT